MLRRCRLAAHGDQQRAAVVGIDMHGPPSRDAELAQHRPVRIRPHARLGAGLAPVEHYPAGPGLAAAHHGSSPSSSRRSLLHSAMCGSSRRTAHRYTASPADPPLLAAAIARALTADPAEHARMLTEGHRLTATRYDYDANVKAFLTRHAS